MVVCVVVLAALLKPLVEPQTRAVVARPLDVSRETALRGLVEAICERLGVAPPASLHLECSTRVAMHARHKRLAIGLPLVACLSAEQLAAAVAGQLAHFRGGAGCPVTNLIRRINHWLWRSVYGRSRFDQWLVIVGERPHFHPAKLLMPLVVLKFIAQAVLFVPMFIANTVASQVVRQADRDADLIAARLIGTQAFAALLERQEQIEFSWEGVLAELDYLYREQSLPDSLPGQLALRMLDMTPELGAALSETVNKSEERPFDSQLPRLERVANLMQSAPRVGILDEPGPARSLVKSYNDLARKLTWDYYVLRFGPERLKTALQPVATPVAVR
jgi:Zn-dependent protease with chaperone function